MTNNLIGKTSITEGHLTSYRMKLTTLSPVFIGGGEDSVIGKTQYLFDTESKRVYILRENEWINFINKKRLFNDYVNFIKLFSREQKAQRGSRPPEYQGGLYEWIKKKNSSITIQEIIDNKCVKYSVNAELMERGHDLRCFIKNCDKKPYLPGSSIKGAIRTAVLFHIISSDKKSYRSYWSEIQERLNNKTAGNLESFICSVLEFGTNNSSLKSIFRAIQVSDSEPIDPKNLYIAKKIDLSTKAKNRSNLKHLTLFREYLKPKTATKLTITVDESMIKKLQIFKEGNPIITILSCLDNQAIAYIDDSESPLRDFENHYFPEGENCNSIVYPYGFPEFGNPNVWLGGGGGFLSKTLVHALAPSKQEANRVIKGHLTSKFSIHRHHEDTVASPRTLKLAESINKQKFFVGWCSLEPDGEV